MKLDADWIRLHRDDQTFLPSLVAYASSLGLAQVGGELEATLIARLQQGLFDAEITLLLASCGNLELLSLDVDTAESEAFSPLCLFETLRNLKEDELMFPPSPPRIDDGPNPLNEFTRLREVDIGGDNVFNAIIPVLQLPTLQRFGSNGLYGDSLLHGPGEHSSMVTDVHLLVADFNFTGFETLLSYCPRIKHLMVQWQDSNEENKDPVEIPLSGFGEILRQYCPQQLESLALNLDDSSDDIDEIGTEPLGDLRSLPALRDLDVSELFLAGHQSRDWSIPDAPIISAFPDLRETLPLTLQSLSISMIRDPMASFIESRIRPVTEDARFEDLNTIRLTKNYRPGNIQSYELEEILDDIGEVSETLITPGALQNWKKRDILQQLIFRSTLLKEIESDLETRTGYVLADDPSIDAHGWRGGS